jgi:hypothetical protein
VPDPPGTTTIGLPAEAQATSSGVEPCRSPRWPARQTRAHAATGSPLGSTNTAEPGSSLSIVRVESRHATAPSETSSLVRTRLAAAAPLVATRMIARNQPSRRVGLLILRLGAASMCSRRVSRAAARAVSSLSTSLR